MRSHKVPLRQHDRCRSTQLLVSTRPSVEQEAATMRSATARSERQPTPTGTNKHNSLTVHGTQASDAELSEMSVRQQKVPLGPSRDPCNRSRLPARRSADRHRSPRDLALRGQSPFRNGIWSRSTQRDHHNSSRSTARRQARTTRPADSRLLPTATG